LPEYTFRNISSLLGGVFLYFSLVSCTYLINDEQSTESSRAASSANFQQGSEALFDAELIYPAYQVKPTDIVLSRAHYVDKLYGFWLAQNIANWTGLITEMDKVGTPETMPFYVDGDWGSADLKSMWGEFVPHADTIDFYLLERGNPWGADDDTDMEYMYQHLLDSHNTSVLSAEQIRLGWLTHIYSEQDAPLYKKFEDSTPMRENFLWVSNERARILMEQGMSSPATSEPENNPHYMMIDAQLTTEIFGLFAPARPDIALKMAYLPIRTTAKFDAQWVAEFYVIMHSLAAHVDPQLSMQQQLMWMADEARKRLPDTSYVADMYDFVKQSYTENPDKKDWQGSRDAVYQRYQLAQNAGYIYQQPFDAGINFAASLVSLFYGEGDILRTIKIGSLAGWDSDNPTATWGGLLGFMLGKEGVERAFAGRHFSDTYWIHRTRRNFPDHTLASEGEDSFDMLAQRGLYIIDRVVLEQMGGGVDLENNLWYIPVAD
jgi:hypothetical protein